MSVRITFELSDQDLRHFRSAMETAKAAARGRPVIEVTSAARILLERVRRKSASDFLAVRLDKLARMIDMLLDSDWQIPRKEKDRVMAALAYFTEEQDLIPDTIPGVGFLDDAIMIELVLRDLRHELEAYEDFCRFRHDRQHRHRPSRDSEVGLAKRREALHDRMRRRDRDQRNSPFGGRDNT